MKRSLYRRYLINLQLFLARQPAPPAPLPQLKNS